MSAPLNLISGRNLISGHTCICACCNNLRRLLVPLSTSQPQFRENAVQCSQCSDRAAASAERGVWSTHIAAAKPSGAAGKWVVWQGTAPSEGPRHQHLLRLTIADLQSLRRRLLVARAEEQREGSSAAAAADEEPIAAEQLVRPACSW